MGPDWGSATATVTPLPNPHRPGIFLETACWNFLGIGFPGETRRPGEGFGNPPPGQLEPQGGRTLPHRLPPFPHFLTSESATESCRQFHSKDNCKRRSISWRIETMPRGWGRGEVEEEGKGLKDPVVAEPDGF